MVAAPTFGACGRILTNPLPETSLIIRCQPCSSEYSLSKGYAPSGMQESGLFLRHADSMVWQILNPSILMVPLVPPGQYSRSRCSSMVLFDKDDFCRIVGFVIQWIHSSIDLLQILHPDRIDLCGPGNDNLWDGNLKPGQRLLVDFNIHR